MQKKINNQFACHKSKDGQQLLERINRSEGKYPQKNGQKVGYHVLRNHHEKARRKHRLEAYIQVEEEKENFEKIYAILASE